MDAPPGPEAKKRKLEEGGDDDVVCSANDCIFFRLVRAESDLADAEPFTPEFTHQLFGDDETILGYKGLAINIYFHAVTFHALIEVSYEKKESGATDVMKTLKEHFPAGFVESRAEFVAMLPALGAVSFADYGKVVHEYKSKAGDSAILDLRPSESSPTAQAEGEWHTRIQPLILFYIDGSSFIDVVGDPKWEVLVTVDKTTGVVAGFSTVYSFYSYPSSTRLRLGQVLILPPHQRRGHASQVFEAVYKIADARDVVDVTVEDPTDELSMIRATADMRRLLAHPATAAAAAAAVAAAEAAGGGAGAAGSLRLKPEVLGGVQRGLRLCRPQVRRCWEGLLYVQPGARGAGAAAAFRGLVTRRLENEHFSSTKTIAEGKRLVSAAEGEGFVMFKSRRPVEGSTVVAMEKGEDGEDVELSEEEKKAKLDQLYGQVINGLETLKARLGHK